jgi:four helix bundle protein
LARIERFEELLSWQKARLLANSVYILTNKPSFLNDYELKNQIRKAAGSVMHNIAEGFESGSDPEFIRFLKFARRSANEVQSELYLALDRDYISQDDQKTTYHLAVEVKRLINGLINYFKKSHASKKTKSKYLSQH